MKQATIKKEKTLNLAVIAANLLRARDAGKEAYGRADELLESLLAHCQVGDTIAIPGGQVVTIVDNFAKGNKSWKPCGINRFDVKVSRAADVTAKL